VEIARPRLPRRGAATAVTGGETTVALFNVDEQLFAVDDSCL
jgi:hypothetical protein